MKELNRTALLAKEELEKVQVDLGKGEFVYVRQMTGRERDNFEQSLLKKNKDAKGAVIGYEQATEDFRAKLAVCTVCDKEGKAIFLPTDYSLLSQNISAKRLEMIIKVANELNAITEVDKENLIKNSDADQEDSSSSGSAKN